VGGLSETETTTVERDRHRLGNAAHHDLSRILETIHHAILTSQERDGYLVTDRRRQGRPFLTLLRLLLLPLEAALREDVAEETLSFEADAVVGEHSMTVTVTLYGVTGLHHHRDGAEICRATGVSPRGEMSGVSSVEKTIVGRSGPTARGRPTA
jgi:hypothetical protein